MKLEDLKIYQLAMEIGEEVWGIVNEWEYYPRDTIGKQFVRAIDSVAANLSEGFGRYHYKESKHFSYYARGSLYESKTWLTKAKNRNLLDVNTFDHLAKSMEILGVKLNNYINSIGSTSNNK